MIVRITIEGVGGRELPSQLVWEHQAAGASNPRYFAHDLQVAILTAARAAVHGLQPMVVERGAPPALKIATSIKDLLAS